jgi:ParB family chromosome partitioning protein
MALSDQGLGKSVSDVLAKTVKRTPEPGRGYLEVDIGLVTASRANPRQSFDAAELAALASSIQQHGMLQPIVVLKQEVGYEILSGERRWRAARLLGLSRIPIVIRDAANPQHCAELRLVENIQRQDLNPIELAQAYRTLLDTHGLTQEALATRINKDRSSIANLLRLLDLPEGVRLLLASGALTAGHGKALLATSDEHWQQALADRIITAGLSVRDTERLAKAGPPQPLPAGVGIEPPHVRELQENLFRLLGLQVAIQEKGGKGTLTVRFRDQAEFQRVVAVLERIVAPPKGGPPTAT